MFYHLCALILIALILGLALIRHCSLYSPLVISAFVWWTVFATGMVFEDRFYPLKENAFFAWMIWFMITWLIFFLFSPSRMKNSWIGAEIRRIPVDYSLLLLVLIAWLGYRIWVVGNSEPDHFFFNLRLSSMNLEGLPSLGLILRFYPLVFALFLFEEVYATPNNRHLRLLLWCFMILNAVAMMGKQSILTPVLAWTIIQGIKGRLKIKKIFLLMLVTFGSMMSLHFIRSGVSYGSMIVDVLSIYIYSPLVAIGYMNIDSSLPIGTHVFRFFYVFGNLMGIWDIPVSSIGYTYIPEPTNVHTAMGTFYYDFGLIGVFFGAIIYGLFFSYLYSLNRNGLGLILYSGCSTILALQFFADILMGTLSLYLQFLIYALAVFLASKKVSLAR